ncbi:hypothetical protein IU470_30265 [Nocardia abscessus]|uniref:Uncharacterized protein n=1 Tax=Nocardia abscessus TaxID=120957 RepID=A0ABS0CLN8_9NOCA|nr:hypothetical protein [Nocardia abscessus]MBF6229363.1 hypothetical protein [Nocardia abscessus]
MRGSRSVSRERNVDARPAVDRGTEVLPAAVVSFDKIGNLLRVGAHPHHWLTDSDPAVERSFHAFVGADGYALTDLRGDLNRFATLLGGGLEIPAQHLHAEPF